jgi:hypothetical protein
MVSTLTGRDLKNLGLKGAHPALVDLAQSYQPSAKPPATAISYLFPTNRGPQSAPPFHQRLQPHILQKLTPQVLDHGKPSKKTQSTSTGVLRMERFHAVILVPQAFSEEHGLVVCPPAQPAKLQSQSPLPNCVSSKLASWHPYGVSTVCHHPPVPTFPNGGSFGNSLDRFNRPVPPSVEANGSPAVRLVNREVRVL